MVTELLLNAIHNTHFTLFRSRSAGTWERGTHWVGSGRGQGSRSLNLTVVCKKESRCEDCIFVCISNCSHIMKRLKTQGIKEDTSSGLKWSSHTSKIKTIFYGFLKQCAYLSQRVRKPEVSHLNSLNLAWIHGDMARINHTESTSVQVKVVIC